MRPRIARIIEPPIGGVYSRAWLSDAFNALRDLGWVESRRPGNDGSIGNTMEDLIGMTENNLKVADAGEFELKSHKSEGDSLVTLFHQDPLPKRRSSPVQYLLLPKYGWEHKTIPNEFSFRQTIRGDRLTNRGFGVIVERDKSQLTTLFDARRVDRVEHPDWFESVRARVGLQPLDPAPFWPLQLLKNRTESKLKNVLFVSAHVKKVDEVKNFKYDTAYLLRNFRFERFLSAIDGGFIYIDYDARTGHNHGTKFRIRDTDWDRIYDFVERLI